VLANDEVKKISTSSAGGQLVTTQQNERPLDTALSKGFFLSGACPDPLPPAELEENSPSTTEEIELTDETPYEEENEAGPIQLEKRGVTSHRQGEFWTAQTAFKFSIAAKLRSYGRRDIADALDDCHSRFIVAQCVGCGATSKFVNRCDRFYCPECQPRLSRKRKESVEWWTRMISQPKHVVLTVANVPDLTKEHVRFLKDSFSRLRRCKFAANWSGGFYSLEVTNEQKGWHLHIHALVDARWIDARQLSLEWEKATRGWGKIIKVKDTRNKSYLQEVTKYAVKGADLSRWTALEIATFIDVFSKVRTFGVFGNLYGKRTEWREWLDTIGREKAVCKCGCNEVRFFDEDTWEQKFLQPTSQSSLPPPTIERQHSFGFLNAFEWPD
jgi:hypothetical protein